jgi:hypothetical protein
MTYYTPKDMNEVRLLLGVVDGNAAVTLTPGCSRNAQGAPARGSRQRLVRSGWAQQRIRVLADALLRCGTLNGDEICSVL